METIFDMPVWWWTLLVVACCMFAVGGHMIYEHYRWGPFPPASDEEIEAWERWFKESGGEWQR